MLKGAVFTAEHRANLSKARRLRPPASAETRAKRSASMMGKRHTPEAKEKMRLAKLGVPRPAYVSEKIKAALAARSPEEKAETIRKGAATRRLRGSTRGRKNPHFGKPTLHGPRTHWVEHRGVKMRSGWERRFAAALDRRGIEWVYEPERFDLGEVTYLPDFYVPEFGAHVEIKGWMDPNSQRRIGLFRERHPELPLIVVNGELLRQFESSL